MTPDELAAMKESFDRAYAYSGYSLAAAWATKHGRALLAEAEEAQRLAHLLALRDRQIKMMGDYWARDAEEALAGDPRALRNRIELRKLGPVEIVQSEVGAEAPTQTSIQSDGDGREQALKARAAQPNTNT